MKVYIQNLYGIKDEGKAYFRKQGLGCFDFVNSTKYATDLTQEEVDRILSHADFYKKQYNADTMGIEA